MHDGWMNEDECVCGMLRVDTRIVGEMRGIEDGVETELCDDGRDKDGERDSNDKKKLKN